MTAMNVVMAYEAAQGREVRDVHPENLGYDVRGLDLQSGELRLIEVKGLAGSTGSILLTPNERRGRGRMDRTRAAGRLATNPVPGLGG